MIKCAIEPVWYLPGIAPQLGPSAPPLATPQLRPCASCVRAMCLWPALHPDGEAPLVSERRPPRLLELAASKVARPAARGALAHPAARGALQARRFKLEEATLRRMLFEHTGGMFPELVTRTDLSVFLPPIGGCTAYIVGDPDSIPDPSKPLAVRVHDECNG